jgi:hypothetical protein
MQKECHWNKVEIACDNWWQIRRDSLLKFLRSCVIELVLPAVNNILRISFQQLKLWSLEHRNITIHLCKTLMDARSEYFGTTRPKFKSNMFWIWISSRLCLLPASRWFLACLTLRPWRWSQCVPPKLRLTFNRLHVIDWGIMLQVGRSRVRFSMSSLYFSVDLFLLQYGPGVDPAPNRNEYQESSWG